MDHSPLRDSFLAHCAYLNGGTDEIHRDFDCREQAYGINSAGRVAGGAATQTGGVSQTAFLWHGGYMIDLGTLPGGLNTAARVINASCEAALGSETFRTDPNGEDQGGI
jgi:probable HAF family extracellular repeat protein